MNDEKNTPTHKTKINYTEASRFLSVDPHHTGCYIGDLCVSIG
ncbi:chemotaxis protein [Bacillus subtilis]|nr:chemotaxis protein [Bacillus subtilis]